MIIKGTEHDLAANRAGRLTTDQVAALRRLPIFTLPYVPGLVLAPVIVFWGVRQGGLLLWLTLAVGALLLLGSVARMRQQRHLERRPVSLLVGQLEASTPAPLRFLEAMLVVGDQEIVVPVGLPGQPLRAGQRYRFYTIEGLARRPLLVSAELDETFA